MPDLIEILRAAIAAGASDVHIVPELPPMARLNGETVPLRGSAPLGSEESRNLIYSMLNESQRANFEQDWELDCSLSVAGLSRFRVNVFLSSRGVAAAIRVIRSQIPSPEEIGLMPSIVSLIQEARGLVLVTGPTGSGKSTTLASLVEMINATQKKTVLTIEDPVEFVYENKSSVILQREVGRQTRSFSEALRRSLRQNPDVILIGEMRDLETIALAITAAETGHLCFATLHTQDAPTTIDRMIDVFPSQQQQQVRIQLSTVLAAVVSQTLLPRKDGKGRVAAREVMRGTPAIRNIIREGKTHMLYAAIESGAKFGMISMDQHLAQLVRQGAIQLEDALSKARSTATLQSILSIGNTG